LRLSACLLLFNRPDACQASFLTLMRNRPGLRASSSPDRTHAQAPEISSLELTGQAHGHVHNLYLLRFSASLSSFNAPEGL
jgi:hypothetical protein